MLCVVCVRAGEAFCAQRSTSGRARSCLCSTVSVHAFAQVRAALFKMHASKRSKITQVVEAAPHMRASKHGVANSSPPVHEEWNWPDKL